jgi:uncharacterized MAPEG superfamily protein
MLAAVHVTLANLTSRPIVALLAFAGWTIVLVVLVLLVRGVMILRKERRINEFPAGQEHGGAFYWRLNRAHANALENLPLFAAIVLGGAALGVSSPRLAMLAEVVVYARIAQSVFHVSSRSELAVTLRFTGLATQLGCFAWMIFETLRLAAGG